MKKRLKLMLPLLLILTLVTNATIPALAQPSVVYAAEQPTNPQQGTETPSSIVLGKGTIEINGHLFTDEEFLTFLNNAKIVRIPFENASTFSLGEYDGLVGNSTIAAGGLTVLSNAIIGVFQKIAVILDLADLDGFAYLVLGTIDVVSAAGVVSVALALAIKFLPDSIEINGIPIGSFNTALADMTSFFENHKKANPDEEIVNPDPGSGGTTKPGEGTGDATQPGEGTGDVAQPGTGTGGGTQPSEDPDNNIKAGDKTPKGREYTQHGADRANERGFDSQKVDSIIDNNYKSRTKEIDKVTGEVTWRYQDKRGNTVITNEWGDKIVTVYSYPRSANGGKYIPKN